MLKTLLVAATELEIKQTKNKLDPTQVLVTGLGTFATIFNLMQKLTHTQYDLVIHAGIAGSFDNSLSLGSVVQINADRFADIGFETPDGNFNDFFGSPLISDQNFPFERGWIFNPFRLTENNLPSKSAITVNTVSGCKETIEKRAGFKADIESMEGAGVFYVCRMLNIKFISIRAISNYVEPRNRNNWKIQEAVKNLNNRLDSFFE